METNNYIEDYFNNRLSEEDKKAFEERLNADQAFALAVKEHALLMNALDELKAVEVSQHLTALEEEIAVGPVRVARFPVYLKWAATIAVFMALSYLVYLTNKDINQELYLAYYTPYPNVESPVSRSESGQQDVWLFYEQGNYAEAAKLFKRNIAKDDNDLSSWFYLGICELEQNRIKEAENAFAKVILQKDAKYFEQAQWYMALSHLHGGNVAITKSSLNEIIAGGSGYVDKAKALFEEIE